jgi:hypothetical protein
MRAFAFLGVGRTSFLTGLEWPAPGTWVERGDDAVRACEPDQLSWWLDDELWEVELDGDIRTLGRALVASRARLVRRIDAWTEAMAAALLLACAHRVRDSAVEALILVGRGEEAAELAASSELDAIEAAGGRIADDGRPASALAGLAADVVLYARDARDAPRAAGVAAYVAAFALAGGDKRAPDYQERFDAERRWQADWLKERLRL